MAEYLSTGISVLDRQLGGGLPAGSVVLVSAAPASQSELLLYELTAAQRTLYLTTIRSDQAVDDALERTTTRTGNPTIRDIGADAPLDHANRLVGTLPEDAYLIVDVGDPLEESDSSRYRNFLNTLQTTMVNTGSVAFLHCLDGRSIPENRDMTEHVADVVFDLQTRVEGSQMVNELAVPKFRGGSALGETIKLELEDRVSIDTSRDIA